MKICKNAKKCKNKSCPHIEEHAENVDCVKECMHPKGLGAICIDVKKKVVEKLVNHPKYCRFSKQLNGLCDRMFETNRCKDNNGHMNILSEDWDHCPREKQQIPVTLVSPLDKLLDEAVEVMSEYIDVAFTKKDLRKVLEVFAKKVKDLK